MEIAGRRNAALGLDAKLLDETRAEVRRARTRRRLAHDAGEVVLPDDDGPEELLAALNELLASGRLSDVQKSWITALLAGEDVGDPPAPDDVAQDDPADLPREQRTDLENLIDHQPTAADRRRAAQAHDAAARFPNAARVVIAWPAPSGQPRLAYDAHTVPAGVKPAAERFSFGKRIRPLGAA